MPHLTSPHLAQLISKLKEIFQINQPELDFGIYRILNSRATEIATFLEKTLPQKIQTALSDRPEQETAVYNHLFTFFSRYYDNGDFISQRRYKNDTYAIPYSGEEVMLHWANKDQYYTKSGENFSNYAFDLNGKKVHFRLVEADIAKDNRKDNEQNRLFVLAEPTIYTEIDENGDEIQRDILPIEELTNELIIRFEYKAMPKGKKQADLIEQAVEKVKSFAFQDETYFELFSLMPTESDKNRTLLKKYLQDYTTKNTADYFIHKNLGKFLNQELDFYIKNEVMNLDNIQAETAFAEIETHLQLIKILKTVAQEIITFLAQLEDFQKKLWLKKKFVAGTHYLITLDYLSDELVEIALQNKAQLEQWQALFNVNASGQNPQEICKTYPHLVVDTSLFDTEFQAKVLAEIDDLDNQTNGLLIQSDNFQALNLLQERYKEQVKCIYIDPPYNTNASEIIYKNGYKHSSWLSLIENRVMKSIPWLKNSGVFNIAIDGLELSNLEILMKECFGINNYITTLAIQHNPKGRDKEFFADSHEYMLIASKDKKLAEVNRLSLSREELIKKYSKGNGEERYRELPLRRSGSEAQREDRPYMFFPFLCEKEDLTLSLLPELEYKEIYSENKFNDCYLNTLKEKYENEGYYFILPTRDNGTQGRWRWGYSSCLNGIENNLLFAKLNNNKVSIYQKDTIDTTFLPKTFWYHEKYDASSKGTNILNSILPNNPFDYPKSIYLVEDAIRISSSKNDIILDYFAGSGTTAHAVINLNREDNGNRKYILVEQGEYFDTVLKPRVQKVIFSEKWKDGKPETGENGFNGISQIVKVLKLESYEDTLNNLELRKPTLTLDFNEQVQNDYLLHYMLNVESRGSLLSTDDFAKPFDYQLNIATSSAGAYLPQKIDLVESFNYLIGLRVKHIDDNRARGVVSVEGVLPSGEKTLIIWRDVERFDYEALNRYLDSRDINPQDSEYDVVYLNGDHNVPTVFADSDDVVRTLKVRSIENEFLARMFN